MKNWTILSESEYKFVWYFIYEDLSYQPHNQDREIVVLPVPHKCFDINDFYENKLFQDLYNELHQLSIECFRNIVINKTIFAMNWQHNYYSFNPNLPFELNEFDEWLVHIFPNGDHLFFLNADYKNGVFGDGVNGKIYIWGKELINTFEASEEPKMLSKTCYSADNFGRKS